MMKVIITAAVVVLLAFIGGKAEVADSAEVADTMPGAQYLFGIYPFQMFAMGLKLEVERREAGSRFSFALSPEFYSGEIEHANDNVMVDANRDRISVSGWGAGAITRYYVTDEFKKGDTRRALVKANFYLFAALEYRSFSLDYTAKSWVKIRENGMDIYRLRDVEVTTDITRINGNIGIGAVLFFGDVFIADAFLYSRASKAYQTSNATENQPYKDSFFTNTGNSFAFGFRFGLLLN